MQCSFANRHQCLKKPTVYILGYHHIKCSDPLTYACQLLLSWRTQTAGLRRKTGVITCEKLDQVSFCYRNLPLCSNVKEYAVQTLGRKFTQSYTTFRINYVHNTHPIHLSICIIYSKWMSGATRCLENACTVLPQFTSLIHSSKTACKVKTHKSKINFPLLLML